LCDNSFTVIKSNIISSKIQKLNLNYRNLPFILKLFNFVCLLIFENETTILKKKQFTRFSMSTNDDHYFDNKEKEGYIMLSNLRR
jgi:hypothetical protein